jgi:hypothetical protein
MRKLIIALALLATISAPAFAGRLAEAGATSAGHDVSVNANMSGNAGATAGAAGTGVSGVR